MFFLDLLTGFACALTKDFQDADMRPGLPVAPAGYSVDHQPDLAFNDLALLRRHVQVKVFNEIAAPLTHVMPYNETKLRIYTHPAFDITLEGGYANRRSLF